MDPTRRNELKSLARRLEKGLAQTKAFRPMVIDRQHSSDWIVEAIQSRSNLLAESVRLTIDGNKDTIERAARVFLRWMQEGTVVRILGAGRARLAAAIPANRLAHGGARVSIQDDMLPMPHTVHGGGIIAATASGSTPSVMSSLKRARELSPTITVIGIAKESASDFEKHCNLFIGIHEAPGSGNLAALADISEYVISEVLDALVVAAGEMGGFDEWRWRLGHENIGATGPYDLMAIGSHVTPTKHSGRRSRQRR